MSDVIVGVKEVTQSVYRINDLHNRHALGVDPRQVTTPFVFFPLNRGLNLAICVGCLVFHPPKSACDQTVGPDAPRTAPRMTVSQNCRTRAQPAPLVRGATVLFSKEMDAQSLLSVP